MKGRLFTEPEQLPNGPKAVIVNEAFARQFFPAQEVLGKQIGSLFLRGEEKQPVWQIVGVVGNVKRRDLTESASPEYYISLLQNEIGPPVFAVRANGDPLVLGESVRRIVSQVDPAVPVSISRRTTG